MDFSFGIPSQRGKISAKAMDLCPNMEALTVCKNAGPRTAKLMVLNTLACERLDLEDGIYMIESGYDAVCDVTTNKKKFIRY